MLRWRALVVSICFFGKNIVGKSTLLEVLFLLAGMSNPDMPLRINRLRGYTRNDWEGIKALFYGFDTGLTVMSYWSGDAMPCGS